MEMSDGRIITGRQSADVVERIKRLVWLLILERMTGMEISEVNSKGGCFRLAVEHLRQLQDSTVGALAWLEKSKAFVPDESKTVQELKDALAKSIKRETELENALTLSEDSRDGLKKNLAKSVEREEALRGNWVKSEDSRVRLEEALALSEDSRDGLKTALAKSIERETELERRLSSAFARERRLTSYIGGLAKMATEAESILEDVKNIGKSDHRDEVSTPWDQTKEGSVEACCENFEECDKQCVPLANYWRNLAKEAEKKGMEHKWNMQWVIPDVTCTADPVKPRPLI